MTLVNICVTIIIELYRLEIFDLEIKGYGQARRI